ncbi:MAG: tRNA (5-methylaminomethyl-2-thiouridine)(34)-methyltransferase MnmD [Bacteroidales bacterium]|nr:tRNA (5-methylaminomethyl-2-thiouridine)(34)-methyltransferase MnmD [Bacteroidales bacterium]
MNIETTADGSVTLYRDDIDEHYHSVKGALAESLHVYLDLGWRRFASCHDAVRVFEVGYGTGLNAALTAVAAAEASVPTAYFSVELYPVAPELTERLYHDQASEYASCFKMVNEAEWGINTDINPWFVLRKMEDNLLTMEIPRNIDVVYFDAFAPEKQPEMWTEHVFGKLYRAMAPGGILTTYCAKGAVRRLLQKVGFVVERLAGPPGGKREVIRATRPLALPE